MTSICPLRIAHVDTGQSLRGGQRQMLMLARGLREHGHEQMIVCVEGSDVEKSARQDGFNAFSLPQSDPGHAFGILVWRQQLRLWRPQIIHAHDGRGQTIAWLASVGLPLKRIASRRVTFFPSDGWTYRLKYGRTCNAVIAVSENIRDLSIQAGVPAERITVIPDGIQIPPELPSASTRQRIRTSWQWQEDDFVVGMLGASTFEKGQDLAIAAMELLADKLPKIHLVIAGDDAGLPGGKPTHYLASRCERITRMNHLEALETFFPGLDLFIMPSRSEGLGSSALWAMAYGLPVIASRVGGLPEIVIENETGWLIPPGSPQALADAIVEASTDRDRLREFGRNGRKQAEAFSAAIMVSRTEALYHRIIGGKH